MNIPDMETAPLDVTKFTKEQFAIKIAEYVIVLGDNLTSDMQRGLAFSRILTSDDVRQRKVKKEHFRTQFEELRTMVRTHTTGPRNGGQGSDQLRGGTTSGVTGGLGDALKRARADASGSPSPPVVALSSEQRDKKARTCIACYLRLKRHAPQHIEQYQRLAERVDKSTFLSMSDSELSNITDMLSSDCTELAPRPDNLQVRRVLQQLPHLQAAALNNEQRLFVDLVAAMATLPEKTTAIERHVQPFIKGLLAAVEKDRSKLNPDALAALLGERSSTNSGGHTMADEERPDKIPAQEEQSSDLTLVDESPNLEESGGDDLPGDEGSGAESPADLQGQINSLLARLDADQPWANVARALAEHMDLPKGCLPQACHDVAVKELTTLSNLEKQLRAAGLNPEGNVREQIRQLQEAETTYKAQLNAALKGIREQVRKDAPYTDAAKQLCTNLGTTPENLPSTIEAALTAATEKIEKADGQLETTRAALRLAENAKTEAELKAAGQATVPDPAVQQLCNEWEITRGQFLATARAKAETAEAAHRVDWWNRLLWKVALGGGVVLGLLLWLADYRLGQARDALKRAKATAVQTQPKPAAAAKPKFEVFKPSDLPPIGQ